MPAHAAEQERATIATAHAAWYGAQPGPNSVQPAFMDETGAATNMACRYGRCSTDKRLVAAIPHGHCKTTIFVARLCHDRINAPCVMTGR